MSWRIVQSLTGETEFLVPDEVCWEIVSSTEDPLEPNMRVVEAVARDGRRATSLIEMREV